MRYYTLAQLSFYFNIKQQTLNDYCNYYGIAPMLGKRPKVFNKDAVDKMSKIVSYIRSGVPRRKIKNLL